MYPTTYICIWQHNYIHINLIDPSLLQFYLYKLFAHTFVHILFAQLGTMPSWLCFSGRQIVGKGGGKAIGLAIGAGATDHLDVWQGIAIDKQLVACSLVFGCRSRCFCIIFRIMFIILYLGCTWALVILFHLDAMVTTSVEQVMEPRDFRGVAHCLGNPARLRSRVQDLVCRLRCQALLYL